MEVRNKYIRYTAVIFTILYSLMPVISRVVSKYLTTYFYMVFVLLFLLIIVGKKRKTSLFEYISAILPFLLYGLMTYSVKTDAVLLWGYRFMLFFAPVVVGIYINFYHSDESKLYSIVIIAALLITCLTTIRGLEVYPDAARWLATVGETQDAKLITYSWMNIGGYDFVYTVVLIYPLLILAFKKGRISILKTIVLVAIMFFCLLLADYTIALILFVVTTSMFFFKKNLKTRDIAIIITATVLFTTVFSSTVSKMLTNVSSLVKSDNVSSRVEALAGGYDALEGLDDNRVELYIRSLTTFARSPIFGTFIKGGGGVGNHSFIFDTIGRYGLCGVIIMFFMYRKLFRLFYKKYHNEEDYGYVVWIFAQAVLLSCINTGMWVNVLALYAPVILHMLYKNENKQRFKEDSNSALPE